MNTGEHVFSIIDLGQTFFMIYHIGIFTVAPLHTCKIEADSFLGTCIIGKKLKTIFNFELLGSDSIRACVRPSVMRL